MNALGLQHPGLLLPGLPNSLPPVAPWSLYPQLAAPQLAAGAAHQAKPETDRDVKLLKRKQANRDSARRSKLKKKQEAEELAVRRKELSETNEALIQKVRDAQARVRQLQETNGTLKEQFDCLAGTSAAS